MSAVLALTGTYTDAAGWLRCRAHYARDCGCQDATPRLAPRAVALADDEPTEVAPSAWAAELLARCRELELRAANRRAESALPGLALDGGRCGCGCGLAGRHCTDVVVTDRERA
jgi:hypothetical protein